MSMGNVVYNEQEPGDVVDIAPGDGQGKRGVLCCFMLLEIGVSMQKWMDGCYGWMAG